MKFRTQARPHTGLAVFLGVGQLHHVGHNRLGDHEQALAAVVGEVIGIARVRFGAAARPFDDARGFAPGDGKNKPAIHCLTPMGYAASAALFSCSLRTTSSSARIIKWAS